MPNRTRTNSDPPIYGTTSMFRNGTDQGYDYSNIMYSDERVMSDVSTPGIREKLESGEIVNNPCLMTRTSRDVAGSGSVTQIRTSGSSDIWIMIGDGSITEYFKHFYYAPSLSGIGRQFDLESMLALSRQRALAQVDSSPYAFGEDVLELRETIAFVRHPLKQLLKLTKSFNRLAHSRIRKNGIKNAKRVAHEVNSAFLQYQFAISPLVRSLCDVIDSLQEKVYRPERRIARGIVNNPIPGADFATRVVTIGSNYKYTYECSVAEGGSCKSGILYEVSNPLSDWKYKFGLRFKDLPEAFWAVVPLSFMVDRIGNISDMIAGLSNLLDPNVKILAAWSTSKHERIETTSLIAVDEINYASSVVPDISRLKTFEYERVVWSPSFSDTLPTFELKGLVDSATKTAELAALILSFTKILR